MYGSLLKRIKDAIRHQIKLVRFLRWYLPYSRNAWLDDAKMKIEATQGLSEPEKATLFSAYCKDYNRYLVKYAEYLGYGFPQKKEKEKKKYLYMRELQIILKKFDFLYPQQRKITDNKNVFLEEYNGYVHRRWLFVDANTPEAEIQQLLDSTDVIVKPTDSCSGHGVYKVLQGTMRAAEIKQRALPLMVEECVSNDNRLAEFHPYSLNTVRVTTITHRNKCRILGAAFRTGNNGSVFDNADSGGYFASIDIETGVINSDGINEKGDVVKCHPASGKAFMGFQIPRWQEVLSACQKATLQRSDSYIIAWDVAITKNGIEFIEGNSRPSIELHQMPLHKGIRHQFYQTLRQLRMHYLDVLCLFMLFRSKPVSRVLQKRYMERHSHN